LIELGDQVCLLMVIRSLSIRAQVASGMGLLVEPDASSFDDRSLPVGSSYAGGIPCSSPLFLPRTSNGAAIFFREPPDHKNRLKSARGYHNFLEMFRSLRAFDPEPWYSCFSLKVSPPFRLARSGHGFP
jgi:hypothetical protein